MAESPIGVKELVTATLQRPVMVSVPKDTDPKALEAAPKSDTVGDFISHAENSLHKTAGHLEETINEMEAQRQKESVGSEDDRALQTSINELRNHRARLAMCQSGMSRLNSTLTSLANGNIDASGHAWKMTLENTHEILHTTRAALVSHKDILRRAQGSGNKILQQMYRQATTPFNTTELLISGFGQVQNAIGELVDVGLGITQAQGVPAGVDLLNRFNVN